MLYGCCTNMLPRSPGSVGEEYLLMLAVLGYDYVELPLGDLVTMLPHERRQSLKKLLADTLPVRACNNFFPNGIRLTGPEPTPFSAIEDYGKRALDTAAELGAEICVFGSPWAKACPEGWPLEAAFEQLTEVCRMLGEAAEKAGVTIALEPNNRSETNSINTYTEVCSLIRAAGHPRIRGLVDYYHLRYENEPLADLTEGGAHLVHTHFARFDGRRFPKDPAEDALYAPYFAALSEIGYEGGISMEGLIGAPADLERDASAALAFFKAMAKTAAR